MICIWDHQNQASLLFEYPCWFLSIQRRFRLSFLQLSLQCLGKWWIIFPQREQYRYIWCKSRRMRTDSPPETRLLSRLLDINIFSSWNIQTWKAQRNPVFSLLEWRWRVNEIEKKQHVLGMNFGSFLFRNCKNGDRADQDCVTMDDLRMWIWMRIVQRFRMSAFFQNWVDLVPEWSPKWMRHKRI